MNSVVSFIKSRPGFLRFARGTRFWATTLGLDIVRLTALVAVPAVVREYFALKRQNSRSAHPWRLSFSMPFFHDRFEESGVVSGHYFHQDLLVARRIFERKPAKHVDVASRVETFVAHVAAFRQIEVFDIRPLSARIPNISFTQCDFMNLPPEMNGYSDSVSCLHALEHFGLGRYCDPIDIDGHLKGFDSLYKTLVSGGILYLSFPIGEIERIEFNAHRVFSIQTVLGWAKDRFELIGFSYVDDAGNLHENIPLSEVDAASSYHLKYGCGIFEMKKL
ncbi:MAG: hypothetical protein JWL63_494 [Rhodocyclales bacterium]|nr:hypothetical protein [Rhodocyclales bacterium]